MVNKCRAYDSPYMTVGNAGQKQVSSTTRLLSWKFALCPLSFPFKRSAKVLTPWSSHFLRKVLLDDARAAVSSFRGNGERISRER